VEIISDYYSVLTYIISTYHKNRLFITS